MRLAGLVLLTAHLLIVCWLTLRPLSVPWMAPSNLHPLASIRADLAAGPQAALRGIGGGVALLAPFGVLLPLASGRLHRPLPGTCVRTVIAGALVSVALTLVRTGVPGRVVDVDAVLLNTVGVALGAVLVFPVVRRVLRRREHGRDGASPAALTGRPVRLRDGESQGSPPRATRVGTAP
ncbi:VanZ family protein [Streptomyces cacaoi]|nr:VanZ family protein [Streptomyces cacaoi]